MKGVISPKPCEAKSSVRNIDLYYVHMPQDAATQGICLPQHCQLEDLLSSDIGEHVDPGQRELMICVRKWRDAIDTHGAIVHNAGPGKAGV